MKIKNSGKEINDESIKEELLQLSINEQETVGTNAVGNLKIYIDCEEEEYKPSHEVYNHYNVVISSDAVYNDEDGQLDAHATVFYHSSIYTDVNSTGADEEIIHVELNNQEKQLLNELINQLNSYRKDENYNWWTVIGNIIGISVEEGGAEIAENVGEVAGKRVNAAFIILDIARSVCDEKNRTDEAKEYNQGISDLQQKYKDKNEWNSTISCVAAEIIAYLKLHGLRAENIEIMKNADEWIDDIQIGEIKSNGDEVELFRNQYENYYDLNCSKGNDSKDGSIRTYEELSDSNGDGRITFEDLTAEEQQQIIEGVTIGFQ